MEANGRSQQWQTLYREQSDLLVGRLVLPKNAPCEGNREPRPTIAVPIVAFKADETIAALFNRYTIMS